MAGSHIICVRSCLAHSDNTQHTHINSNNWHTAGQILYDVLTIYVPVFKMFIFTVVKNLALNKRTRGPDLPALILFKLHELG